MKKDRRAKKKDPVHDADTFREMASDWVIQKAGELGITDDVITKRHMLDAYLDENDHSEEVRRG